MDAGLDPPEERIGWLKMLIEVWRGAGAELYAELIADAERLIAESEKELEG